MVNVGQRTEARQAQAAQAVVRPTPEFRRRAWRAFQLALDRYLTRRERQRR